MAVMNGTHVQHCGDRTLTIRKSRWDWFSTGPKQSISIVEVHWPTLVLPFSPFHTKIMESLSPLLLILRLVIITCGASYQSWDEGLTSNHEDFDFQGVLYISTNIQNATQTLELKPNLYIFVAFCSPSSGNNSSISKFRYWWCCLWRGHAKWKKEG